MSFQLFEIQGNQFVMSDASIKQYLSAELGFSSTKARNDRILATMDNPSAMIQVYNTALDNLVKKGAGHYKYDYDKLLTLGLSDEKAQTIAKQKAEAFINSEKTILDFEFPLMGDINILASAQAKTSIQIPSNQGIGKGRKRK